jgi:pilus assembly protein CpaB
MRPKALALLGIALGCGLVAAVGINQVLAGRRDAGSGSAVETVDIFVAGAQIGIGDLLKPENVKLQSWPKDQVPVGALLTLEDVKGRRTRQTFYPGEPILEAKLLAPGESGMGATDLIPDGMRVVPVHIDSKGNNAGLMKPGDRVDVVLFVPQNPQKGIAQSITKTLLQNVKVFAVDETYQLEEGSGKKSMAKTVSILVTLKQAQEVMLAQELGQLRLMMRSVKDGIVEEAPTVTANDLLGLPSQDGSTETNQSGPASPNPAATAIASAGSDLVRLLQQQMTARNDGPAGDPTPPARKPQWKMVLIHGAEAEELEFYRGERLPRPANKPPAGFAGAPPGSPVFFPPPGSESGSEAIEPAGDPSH